MSKIYQSIIAKKNSYLNEAHYQCNKYLVEPIKYRYVINRSYMRYSKVYSLFVFGRKIFVIISQSICWNIHTL